ncbi:MAG TPA: hypothetical protein VLA13_02035 [Massilibacterium sp.]|nr:hypothetical protein [Massilibacterium sp.]
MTTIKDIQNETFTVTSKTDISNLSAIINSQRGQQMDDTFTYNLERVLDGNKRAKRTYTCVKIDGQFVRAF